MKLKYIFLSLLTLATLSGCDNEELIGPGGNNNNQGEGLPAVLMINGSTNENVETKVDNSEDGDLYVFVFNAGGTSLLGKGCSTDEDKSDKIATIVNTNVAPQSKDVIVVGDEMLSGTDVDVILIANPPEKVKELYTNITSFNLATLTGKLTSLEEQSKMYEDNSGRSTSCQRITMTLSRGINFCGEARADITDQTWCTSQFAQQIPLYRLISQVNLKSISCEGKVISEKENKSNFVLQKAYLASTTFANKTSAIPNASISSGDKLTDKGLLGAVESTDASSNMYVKLGQKTHVINETWAGIVITYGTTANAPKCTQVAYQRGGNTYWPRDANYDDLIQPLYTFRNGNNNPLLVLEGYYKEGAGSITSGQIIKQGKYVRYTVEIKNKNDEMFHRNMIYNVHVTITGQGTDPDDKPIIDTSEQTGVSANIEIANMAEQGVDFEFGGDN